MKICEICFSPTGGTKKAADILAKEFDQRPDFIDLTNSKEDFSSISIEEDTLALIAVPSYGGRVPQIASQRISCIHGNGTKAIILCVYGNRAYDDTLAEERDIASEAGFHIIAAVTAIAEHSICRQFAAGRPDVQDTNQLIGFTQKIKNKLNAKDFSTPNIKGAPQYKKNINAGMIPKPTRDCVRCGLCAMKCPVQAIDHNNPKKVSGNICISCMRCTYICPHSARKVSNVKLAAVNTMLKKACSNRKECELYI